MRFLPNYPFYVLREDEYPYAIEVLEGRLADYRHEGFFDTFDGRTL